MTIKQRLGKYIAIGWTRLRPGTIVTAIRGVKDGFLVEVITYDEKVSTVYRLTLFDQPPEQLFSTSDDLLKP